MVFQGFAGAAASARPVRESWGGKVMEVAEMLGQTSLFSGLDQRDLRRLASAARVHTYPASQTIIREGHKPHGFFIIRSGKVEVVKGADTEHPTVLRTMGPDEFFGEVALIEHKPRTATVRALEDTECIAIWREDFASEVRRNPELAVRMLSSVLQRLSGDEDD
jgi:CRP-like cAMP-binding protein